MFEKDPPNEFSSGIWNSVGSLRSLGTVPPNDTAKRQLRQDLQLVTEADYSIVLTRAEKLHPGIYTFLKGDPRQNADRVQALFESF